MKIDQLPIGARFVLNGKTFTKVGPMTAAADAGGTSFIPKHATLQALPGESAPEPAAARTLDAGRVRAAFEAYHQAALHIAGEERRTQLEAARERFLGALR